VAACALAPSLQNLPLHIHSPGRRKALVFVAKGVTAEMLTESTQAASADHVARVVTNRIHSVIDGIFCKASTPRATPIHAHIWPTQCAAAGHRAPCSVVTEHLKALLLGTATCVKDICSVAALAPHLRFIPDTQTRPALFPAAAAGIQIPAAHGAWHWCRRCWVGTAILALLAATHGRWITILVPLKTVESLA